MGQDAPNNAKITARLGDLQRLRRDGAIKIGWEQGEISPPSANHLVAAGLAVAEQGVRTGEYLKPAE